jgi:acyl CoA:acetate/3-ketoacid CoA transferase beta subunit
MANIAPRATLAVNVMALADAVAAHARKRATGLELTAVNRGVTVDDVREATGWDLLVRDAVDVIEVPTPVELEALRGLRAGQAVTADHLG